MYLLSNRATLLHLIELIWESLNPSAKLQSITFEWLGETAKKIYDYRKAGVTGGSYGIYHGLPLRLEPCSNNLPPFELLLDTINESVEWECDRVTTPIIERGRKDWLEGMAASFSFAYLANVDSINTAAS